MKSLARAFRSSELTFPLGFLRDPMFANVFSGGRETIAGAHITPHNALRISGWYSCVRIISESVAMTPLLVYQKSDGATAEDHERAQKHPLYRVLHRQPNPWMTPMDYFSCSQAHLLNWGNAFSLIERNGAGQIVALWPLYPAKVRLQLVPEQGRIWYYYYAPGGGEYQVRMEDMLHVRGMSSDGILGYSPVDLQREALGLAKIEEEYRARFFRNDARPGGIIEYMGAMNDEVYKRFKRDWNQAYQGAGNSHRVAFLENGFKWHDVGVPPEVAQFIQGRQFQLEEIARILGVPLVLLQSTEKTTSWGSGVAEINRAFYKHCLMPWFTRWEDRANISLFTPNEQEAFFAEHELKNFLRADPKDEAEVLEIMRRNGAINANEWRRTVNLNGIGAEGDKYIVMTNMTTLDKIGQEQPGAAPGAPPPPDPATGRAKYLNGAAH